MVCDCRHCTAVDRSTLRISILGSFEPHMSVRTFVQRVLLNCSEVSFSSVWGRGRLSEVEFLPASETFRIFLLVTTLWFPTVGGSARDSLRTSACELSNFHVSSVVDFSQSSSVGFYIIFSEEMFRHVRYFCHFCKLRVHQGLPFFWSEFSTSQAAN